VAPKTSWGEPDLQGIWTDEFDTPFQRPAKYANQEFFTDARTRRRLDLGDIYAYLLTIPPLPDPQAAAILQH
jgi:hypothetical protein